MDDVVTARLEAWRAMNKVHKALCAWYRMLKSDDGEALKIVGREMIEVCERSFAKAYREWAILAFPEDDP